eukprot:6211465-Pleurochrysis_carterae.AAC.4
MPADEKHAALDCDWPTYAASLPVNICQQITEKSPWHPLHNLKHWSNDDDVNLMAGRQLH